MMGVMSSMRVCLRQRILKLFMLETTSIDSIGVLFRYNSSMDTQSRNESMLSMAAPDRSRYYDTHTHTNTYTCHAHATFCQYSPSLLVDVCVSVIESLYLQFANIGMDEGIEMMHLKASSVVSQQRKCLNFSRMIQ